LLLYNKIRDHGDQCADVPFKFHEPNIKNKRSISLRAFD
jgi:hypothetical protein